MRRELSLLWITGLGALGVISYIVWAAVVQCPTTGTCTGTINNDVITRLIDSTSTPINALAGNDHIIIDVRSTAAVVVNAGEGNDAIFDSSGASTLNGEDGNDRIFASAGADTISGGPGNDWIHGGDEIDTINGGLGNDVIDGGLGSDIIDGAGGNDTYILRRGEAGTATETIQCTTNPLDRSVVKLVGFAREDLALQGLSPGILPPGTTEVRERSGTATTPRFLITGGSGRCILAISSR